MLLGNVLIVVGLAVFLTAANISARKENKRRKSLPVEEQERLKNEDDVWLQYFRF